MNVITMHISCCCGKGRSARLPPFAPRRLRGLTAAFAERKATNEFPQHKHIAIVGLALLPLLIGCGRSDNRAEVSGTIRLNGEPLATGTISFVPMEGTTGPSSGGHIIDGEYHVPGQNGVAVGKNRVSILSVVKTGRKIGDLRGESEDEKVQVVPRKYNTESEVICTVQPGSNRLDFDLKGQSSER
jgi:hypothetical protein